MEQVYYTQCPMGYGLGASNGFQVKRISVGYPLTADFRHLGLRSVVPGVRGLAPPVLRYRRDGDCAEIAWLTPRASEYETERGLWGRPGGHFAHGMRMSAEELAVSHSWPAGLYDAAFWRRSDRERTLGRVPDPVDLATVEPAWPARFGEVAKLVESEEHKTIARLLSAVANAVAQGRALFLIGEPARIARLIAAMTFVFPEPMRAEITFSTYHDRPEELSGFRVQGTSPGVRPNRLMLASQGVVADLATGAFEPAIEPRPWSEQLASWLLANDDAAALGWEKSCMVEWDRKRWRGCPRILWTDAWLNHSIAGRAIVEWEWPEVPALVEQAVRCRFQGAWAGLRKPAWWLRLDPRAQASEQVHAAWLTWVRGPQAWGARPEIVAPVWGEVAGRWFAGKGTDTWIGIIGELFDAAGDGGREALVQSLLVSAPEQADMTLRIAETRGGVSPLTLLGWRAVRALFPAPDQSQLASIFRQACATAGTIGPLLEKLAAAIGGDGVRLECCAKSLAAAIEMFPLDSDSGFQARSEILAWCLSRPDGGVWLRPILRDACADSREHDGWKRLRHAIADDRVAAFTTFFLQTALESAEFSEAFCWGVEQVLLPSIGLGAVSDRSFPGHYLERLHSDLALYFKSFAVPERAPGLRAWLETAAECGELSPEQAERLEQCRQFACALNDRSVAELQRVSGLRVPPEERVQLLRLVLRKLDPLSTDKLAECLKVLGAIWGRDEFERNTGLATPIAERLAVIVGSVAEARRFDKWRDSVNQLLDSMGFDGEPAVRFRPDGLVAQLIARTNRLEPRIVDTTAFRCCWLKDDNAWKALGADFLASIREATEPIDALCQWEDMEVVRLKDRVFELMLNLCDEETLLDAAGGWAKDLKSLGSAFPWWGSNSVEGATNDLRDRLARTIPLVPHPKEEIFAVLPWLDDNYTEIRGEKGEETKWEPRDHSRKLECLSQAGRARWLFVEACSEVDTFATLGYRAAATHLRSLPWKNLDADDRWRVFSWLLYKLEPIADDEWRPLAHWASDEGLNELDRWSAWPANLADEYQRQRDRIRTRRKSVERFVDELRSQKRGRSELLEN